MFEPRQQCAARHELAASRRGDHADTDGWGIWCTAKVTVLMPREACAMFLRLRLCAIVALVSILAAIAGYVSLAVHTFNAYCTAERGDLIQTGLSDPAIWQLQMKWLVITALPCLFARRSISLKLFAGIAAGPGPLRGGRSP